MAKKKDPSARNATYNTGANPDDLDWSGFNTGESPTTAEPTERTKRTWGEAAGDTGVGLLKGAVQGAHDLINFGSMLGSAVGIEDDPNSGIIDKPLNKITGDLQGLKSEVIALKEQRLGAMIQDPNVTIPDVLAYVKDNPDLLGQLAVESLPAMAIGAGVSGGLAKLNAVKQFAAAGKFEAAVVGGIGEGMLIGGSVAHDTGNEGAGAAATLMGIATSAVTPGNIGSAVVNRVIGKGANEAGGLVVGTGKAMLAEGAQEFGQETGQALITNEAKTGEWGVDSATKQGAVGAVLGAAMGGGFHLGGAGYDAVKGTPAETTPTAEDAARAGIQTHLQQAQQALAADPTNPVLQNEVESARAALAAATTTPAQRQQVADVSAAASATEIMGADNVDSAVDSFNQANQTSAALRTGAQIAEEAGAAIREVQGSYNPATAEFDTATTPAPATVTPGGPTPAGVTADGTTAVASAAPAITSETQTITPTPAAGRPLMASGTILASVPPGTPNADAILQVANWQAGRDPVTNISRIVAGMAGDPSETRITRPPGIAPVVWEAFVRDAQMETGIMLQHDGGIGRTVREGLQEIATRGSRPGRMLAERLLATNNPYLDFTVGTATRGRGVVQHDGLGRVISMAMNPNEATESAFIHESLHALTLSWLYTVPQNDPLYRELKQLMNRVKSEANSRGMTFYGTHPGNANTERARMAEFLAEAFTRSTFQTFLDSIQVESHRTGWDTFVAWVGRLIGTTEPRQLSALDLALRINDNVLSQSSGMAAVMENQPTTTAEPTPEPTTTPTPAPAQLVRQRIADRFLNMVERELASGNVNLRAGMLRDMVMRVGTQSGLVGRYNVNDERERVIRRVALDDQAGGVAWMLDQITEAARNANRRNAAPASATPASAAPTATTPLAPGELDLNTDGIQGREIPHTRVPNGNDAFQYAIGRTTTQGVDSVFRRRADERGTYGGWRWETEITHLLPESATPAPAANRTPEQVVSDAADAYRAALIAQGDTVQTAEEDIDNIYQYDDELLRNIVASRGTGPTANELRAYAQAVLDERAAQPAAAPVSVVETARQNYIDRQVREGMSQSAAESRADQIAGYSDSDLTRIREAEGYWPEAEVLAQAILAERAAATPTPAPAPTAAPAVTSVADAIVAYRTLMRAQGDSDLTIDRDISTMRSYDEGMLRSFAEATNVSAAGAAMAHLARALLNERSTPAAAPTGLIDIDAEMQNRPAPVTATTGRRTRQSVQEAATRFREIERQNGASDATIDRVMRAIQNDVGTSDIAAIEADIQALEDANAHSEAEYMRALLDQREASAPAAAPAMTLSEAVAALTEAENAYISEQMDRFGLDEQQAEQERASIMSEAETDTDEEHQAGVVEYGRLGENAAIALSQAARQYYAVRRGNPPPAAAQAATPAAPAANTAQAVEDARVALAAAREAAILMEMNRYGFDRSTAEEEVLGYGAERQLDDPAHLRSRANNQRLHAWAAPRADYFDAAANLGEALAAQAGQPVATDTGAANDTATQSTSSTGVDAAANDRLNTAFEDALGAGYSQAVVDNILTLPTAELLTGMRRLDAGPELRSLAFAVLDVRRAIPYSLEEFNRRNNAYEAAVQAAATAGNMTPHQIRTATNNATPAGLRNIITTGAAEPTMQLARTGLELLGESVPTQPAPAAAPAATPTSTPAPAPQLTAAQRAARTRAQNRFIGYLPTAFGGQTPTDDSNRQNRSDTLRHAVTSTVSRLRRHPHAGMTSERDRAVRSLVNNMGADAAERWMHDRINAHFNTTPTIRVGGSGSTIRAIDYASDIDIAENELLRVTGYPTYQNQRLSRAVIMNMTDNELQALFNEATQRGWVNTLGVIRAVQNLRAFNANQTIPHARPTPTPPAPRPAASTSTSSSSGRDAFPTRARRLLGTGVLERLVRFWRDVMGEPGQDTMGDIDISDLIGHDTQASADELARRYNVRLHERAVEWAREHGEPAPPYQDVILSISNPTRGARTNVALNTRGLARRGNPYVPQMTPVPTRAGYTWRQSTTSGASFDSTIHASSLAATPGAADLLYRVAADMARIKGHPGIPSDSILSTVNNLRRQMQSTAASLRTNNPNLISPLTSSRNEGPQAISPDIWNAASDEEKIGLNILRTIESVIGYRGDHQGSLGRIYSNLRLQPDGTFLAIGQAAASGGVPDGTRLTFDELKALVSSSQSFAETYGVGGVGAGAASFAVAANTVLEALEHDINSTLPDTLIAPVAELGRANAGWFFSQDEGTPDRDYQTEIESLMAEHAMPDTTNERRAEINAEIAAIQDEMMEMGANQPFDAEASRRMEGEYGRMVEAGAAFEAAGAGRATPDTELFSMDQGVPSDPNVANSPAGQAVISTQPVSPASQNEIRIQSEQGKNWIERLSNRVRKAIQDKHVTLGGILRALKDTRALNAIDRFDGLRQSAFERLATEPMAEIESILDAAGISRAEFENHLIQRHVREYNTHIIGIAPLQITRDPTTGEEIVRGYDHETRPASGVDQNGEPYTTSRADAYMEQEHNPAMLRAAEAYTAMIRGLQEFAVESGLESRETIDRWNMMFPNYVPFRRDLDVEEGMSGTGSGFSVREGISQRAMGSTAGLVDPLPATLEMMVRVVDRGEKAKIGQTLLATARSRPIPLYETRAGNWRPMWRVDSMPNIRSVKRVRVYNVLDANGQPILNGGGEAIEFYNGADARAFAANIQRSARQNQVTGQNPIRVSDTGFHDRVVMAHNPAYINKDNVLVIPENGENHVLVFDEQSEQAMDMVRNLKNMDSAQLNGIFKIANVFSRWTVGTATGYNPFFAPINFIRDIQSSAINMGSTDVPGWTARDSTKMLGDAVKNAPQLFRYLQAKHRAIHDNEPHPAVEQDSPAEWMEFAKESGGLTGIRESFATFDEAVQSVQRLFGEGRTEAQRDPRQREDWANRTGERASNAYDAFTRWLEGDISNDARLRALQKFTSKAPVAISNLNNAFELATRVAAFKSAFEKYEASGLSREEAAEKAAIVSKNVSVNFNRRGTMTSQMNALFPFFNAAAQGSARLAELLFEKVETADIGRGVGEKTRLTSTGKKVLAALPALGAMQALMLAAAGFEDDQPPEHVRSRNLIIPTGGTSYKMLPLPLGLNALFNMGREGMDAILYPNNAPKHLMNMVTEPLTAFNPLGSTPNKALILSPAALDIPLALYMNEDAFGRQIFKEDRDPRRPTPGFTRHKEGTSQSAIAFAEALNKNTGGSDYKGGMIDITGDQVEYLLGQLGGGITREAMKTGQYAVEVATGSKPSEDRPWYKVPLVGKFAGDVGDSSAIRDRLYKLSAELNALNAEFEGLKDGKDKAGAKALRAEHPELDKRDEVEKYFNAEAKLRKERTAAQRAGDNEKVAEINEKLRTKGEALVLEIEKIKERRAQ